MAHWDDVETQEQFDMNVKMYRPVYKAGETQIVANENKNLDHVAFDYLDDSTYMYKILDLNFIELMENRFDVTKLKNLTIPVQDKEE
jgi:hypothetical protein